MAILSVGGVSGVKVCSVLAFFQPQASEWKVHEFSCAARALSQHQNEPGGQSPLGLLAPRNLATWLARPPDLAGMDREGTPNNYWARKAVQTVLEKQAMQHSTLNICKVANIGTKTHIKGPRNHKKTSSYQGFCKLRSRRRWCSCLLKMLR